MAINDKSKLKNWDILILAAGKGSRMNSKLHKSLIKIEGKNLIEWGAELAWNITGTRPNIILGYDANKIIQKNTHLNVNWIVQDVLGGGTAAALHSALHLHNFRSENILVLYVDDAFLYSTKNISNLCIEHEVKNNVMTILTFDSILLPIGGVLYDKNNIPQDTVSYEQAVERKIDKLGILCGAMAINKKWFIQNYLKIKINYKDERGLPELIHIAYEQCNPVTSYPLGEGSYWQGINTRKDLVKARYLKKKQLKEIR